MRDNKNSKNNKSIKDAILARHTTVKYNPNYVLPESDIDEIVKLTQLAPSGLGVQQAKLIVIKNKEFRTELLPFMNPDNKHKVLDSSAVFMITGITKEFFQKDNYQALVDRKIKYISNSPEEIETRRKNWGAYLDSKPAIEDIRAASILASYLTLITASMDLNSTIMGGFDEEKMTEYLRNKKILTKYDNVQLLIAVGKEDENFAINKLSKQHRIRVDLKDFVKKIY